MLPHFLYHLKYGMVLNFHQTPGDDDQNLWSLCHSVSFPITHRHSHMNIHGRTLTCAHVHVYTLAYATTRACYAHTRLQKPMHAGLSAQTLIHIYRHQQTRIHPQHAYMHAFSHTGVNTHIPTHTHRHWQRHTGIRAHAFTQTYDTGICVYTEL